MADTQKFVTGTVRLKFFKGNCHVVGRKSPFSLYDYGPVSYTHLDVYKRQTLRWRG